MPPPRVVPFVVISSLESSFSPLILTYPSPKLNFRKDKKQKQKRIIMSTFLLYFSGFAFIALHGITMHIIMNEDFFLQGEIIKKIINNKVTLIISLIIPILSWIQIFEVTLISLGIIIAANTLITLYLSSTIAIPFLLLIPSRFGRAGKMLNTFLLGIITLIIGLII